MTKQELMNTYDSMSMPDERVAAIEARLMKLFENTETSDNPEFQTEPPKEYRFTRKKPFAVKTAAISLSAAAAVVLLVVGGRYLLNELPISSDPPIDSETEETTESPFNTEKIRFESADDIPAYERAGCFDDYEHSLISGVENTKADPRFAERLREEKPVSVVRIKVTSEKSWDEEGFTEYSAKITECLSGKQLTASDETIYFQLGSTHSKQITGEPSLAVGDELIAVAAEENGEISLVLPDELLFECFSANGQDFAAQRHWYWLDLADNASNYQYGDILRITTVTDNPVAYYGIYEQKELASALEQLVLVSDKDLSLGTEPLPDLYSDFTLDFGLVEPFCYYWFNESNELIRIDAREDIFGSVHGYESEDVPDMYCAGFCEDDLGWYMRSTNSNGGDSMFWIPKSDPEHMYEYYFGSDVVHTRADYNERYLRQGKGDWSFSDPNNDGSFYDSAQQINGRQPAENYVGQISWLGKEKLCADHGDNWAAEFNKWYNCGESIVMNGYSYTRKLLMGAGGAKPPFYYGMGDVWLIDHTDTRIVAAFRFTADDETDAIAGAARYFILTAEYKNGNWQESWQERTNIDAMMMQGVISPANFSSGLYDKRFAWGTDYYTALISTGSDLFTCDTATDEYYLINSYSYCRYLQIDNMLYVIGRETDGIGMYLSAYVIGSGELAFQSPFIAGSTAEEFFLSPDQKYIVIVTTGDNGEQMLYVCDRYTAEFVATASNIPGETQFTIDDNGFTITKDGREQRYDYDMAGLIEKTVKEYCKQPNGSYYTFVTSPYIDRGEMQSSFNESALYYYDSVSKNYSVVLKDSCKAAAEDGATLYVMGAEQGHCIYRVEYGEYRTLVDRAFFELHELPADKFTMEIQADGNLALFFEDSRNTVWLFNKNSGQFITEEKTAAEDSLLNENTPAEGEAYYDNEFKEFDINPVTVGYPSYEDLLYLLMDAQAHYGSKAQFNLCRTVRVLPNNEARKYIGSSGDRTVYEVQLIENLITGEKSDKTVMLVMTMGSPEVQKTGDPIYAPGEIFACAMLEDTDKGCMQSVYGYRYDIRLDGSDRIAYSRQNLELDGLALEGSENISAKAVTSTTKNPAVYTQRLPLSSVAEFVAKEWSEHGIG